jgi:DNA-binding NarL/FixJ family response regulator
MRLTQREREVLTLLARGMKQSKIAETLVIAPRTVYVHVNNIRQKTGVQSTFELAVNARRIAQSVTI